MKFNPHNDDYYEHRMSKLEAVYENTNQTLIRLENRMDEGFKSVNSRIWFNFYWMIAGFASILGVIAKTQHWI